MDNKYLIRESIYKKIFSYAFLILLILFAVFPCVWMVLTSIKPAGEIFTSPPRLLTENPTFANYIKVIFHSNIPRAFLNSVLVTVITTILTLIVSILAGFGLARSKFKSLRILSVGILFSQLLPSIVIVLPLYMVFSSLGLLDTYASLIIANLSIVIPMGVFMLKSYFKNVPVELEESAKIDGCTGLKALFIIVMPVAIPGVIAVSIYAFLNTWQQFLYALNFTHSSDVKTLPIALLEFRQQFKVDWGSMMSASVVISFPVLMVFFLCNKYFVKGVADGSVKG